MSEILSFILHIDEHLASIIANYGTWTYLILFTIIFVETGLVIMPFLPGDSLLFAAGTFAALGVLDVKILLILLSVAAILGDTVNYWIGHFVGDKAFSTNSRFLKREHLERTQAFYEKHGGKTIILARFIPIVRTFAPFVAGIGTMDYKRFLLFNVVGGVAWVSIFTLAGYVFGNIPFVRANFELVVVAIIGISVLPMIYEFVKNKREKMMAAKQTT